MKELSGALLTLRAPEPFTPSPGFYSQVSRRVEVQRPRSLWSFVWLEPAFGRRLAFASLLTLAILGSYTAVRPLQNPKVGIVFTLVLVFLVGVVAGALAMNLGVHKGLHRVPFW